MRRASYQFGLDVCLMLAFAAASPMKAVPKRVAYENFIEFSWKHTLLRLRTIDGGGEGSIIAGFRNPKRHVIIPTTTVVLLLVKLRIQPERLAGWASCSGPIGNVQIVSTFHSNPIAKNVNVILSLPPPP